MDLYFNQNYSAQTPYDTYVENSEGWPPQCNDSIFTSLYEEEPSPFDDLEFDPLYPEKTLNQDPNYGLDGPPLQPEKHLQAPQQEPLQTEDKAVKAPNEKVDDGFYEAFSWPTEATAALTAQLPPSDGFENTTSHPKEYPQAPQQEPLPIKNSVIESPEPSFFARRVTTNLLTLCRDCPLDTLKEQLQPVFLPMAIDQAINQNFSPQETKVLSNLNKLIGDLMNICRVANQQFDINIDTKDINSKIFNITIFSCDQNCSMTELVKKIQQFVAERPEFYALNETFLYNIRTNNLTNPIAYTLNYALYQAFSYQMSLIANFN